MMTRLVAGLDDVLVRLDAPEQLADISGVLSSRTRLAVLRALVASKEPLHINELARRVHVDASPVRTHLELLVKAGLAREVSAPAGRERRFVTALSDVRLVLEGVNRVAMPEKAGPPPKAVVRLERKLLAIEKDRERLADKMRRLQEEVRLEWERAAAKPVKPAK